MDPKKSALAFLASAGLMISFTHSASAEEPNKDADAAKEVPAVGTQDTTPPSDGSQPATSAEAGTDPAAEGEGDSITRGLSWDLMAGGIPQGGALIEANLGFSALPRAAYHYSLQPNLSVGGMVSFDYAYWVPDNAFRSALLLQAPVRYGLVNNESMSVGLRADPGLGFFFRPGAFAVLLNVAANIGFPLESRMVVGGGVDIPMALRFGNGHVSFALPLLFGPIFEYHVTPPLALTADVKIGPFITTDGTVLGFRMLAGIAYRM